MRLAELGKKVDEAEQKLALALQEEASAKARLRRALGAIETAAEELEEARNSLRVEVES